jgi:hypothetical protein
MMPATTTTPAKTLNHGLDVWPLSGEVFGPAAGDPTCIAASTLDMAVLDDGTKPEIIGAKYDNEMTFPGY